MKKTKLTNILAVVLSITYVVFSIWNGFTRSLGSYYYPDETRKDAIVSSFIFAAVISLVLFGLLFALKRKKLFAEILWIIIAPALFMLSWDTITKNLVENGRLAVGWLTDSAYLQEPGASAHRTVWIISGIIVALPFVYSVYSNFTKREP
jgi:hypothetical protein